MKFSIVIDQFDIAKAGLWKKTDLIDWAIIDFLKSWYLHTDRYIIDREGETYALIDYETMIIEMPALRNISKREFYERLDKMAKLKLLKIRVYGYYDWSYRIISEI